MRLAQNKILTSKHESCTTVMEFDLEHYGDEVQMVARLPARLSKQVTVILSNVEDAGCIGMEEKHG